MDEKLKCRLVELSTAMVTATDFDPIVEQFEQAFKDAGYVKLPSEQTCRTEHHWGKGLPKIACPDCCESAEQRREWPG